MSKNENEFNNYIVNNPDGANKKTTDNKIVYKNDKLNFVYENNVNSLNEQKKVGEKYDYSKTKKKNYDFKMSNNLLAISSVVASSVVTVASAVVIVVFFVANSIISVSPFICTGDSMVFYIQAKIDEEKESPLMARLMYDNEIIQEQEVWSEPYLWFYELMPDTYYTLSIYDYASETEVFNGEYKTAKEDCIVPYLMEESWFEEDGTLYFSVYVEMESYIYNPINSGDSWTGDGPNNQDDPNNQDEPIYEEEYTIKSNNIGFYTVLVLDKNGNQLFVSDETESEKSFEMNFKDEELVYVCAKYTKNGLTIGMMQEVYNSYYWETHIEDEENGYHG